MIRSIFIAAFLLVAKVAFTQSAEYQQAMQNALIQLSQSGTVADMQAAGNRFQTIANAETSEWLPLYYQAQSYILMSFMEPTDVAKKEGYLDQAAAIVEKLMAMAPNEAEVNTLQAFLYIGRLVINPMERGMQYSPMASASVARALALEPANPRARMLKLQLDMGAAPFMGQDPKSFCPAAKELMASWDEYVPKSPFYPRWGKEQLAEVLKGCQ